MSQLQALADTLLAAGGAMHPKQQGTYLLYTDEDSSLLYKFFEGTEMTDTDVIAYDIRPNSSASYLYTSAIRLAVCISTDSKLRVLKYDEGEWSDDETFPNPEVHLNGQVAACCMSEDDLLIFFQDPSGNLLCLDRSWKSTILPAKALAGSPISVTMSGIESGDIPRLYVVYIGEDRSIHALVQEGDQWKDRVLLQCKIEEKVKRVRVGANGETKTFEVYALTEDSTMLKIAADAEADKDKQAAAAVPLGKVNGGKFVAAKTAECCPYVWSYTYTYTVAVCGWYYYRGGCCW